MTQLLRVLVVGLALGVTGAPATGAPPKQAPGPWQVAQNDFVHYHLDVEHYGNGDDPSTDPREPMYGAFGFYGYELLQGERPQRVLTQEEWLLLPYVFWMPKQLLTKGRSLVIKDKFDEYGRMQSRVEGRGKVVNADVRKKAQTHEVDLIGNAVFKIVPHEVPGLGMGEKGAGRITWKSTFDAASGLMRRVEFAMTVDRASGIVRPNGTEANARRDRLTFKGTLVLNQHLKYRYPGFKDDVGKAIDRGMAAVDKRRERDDGWHKRTHYPTGSAALAALTLIKGGWSREAKGLTEALAWLAAQDPAHTYSVGMALAAFEANGAPARELGEGEGAAGAEHGTRVLTKEQRAYVEKATAWLLETARMGDSPGAVPKPKKKGRRKRKPAAVTGTKGFIRWWYPRHPGVEIVGGEDQERWDNSNSQYAVLGLHSASLCDVRIPKHVWFRILGHFLMHQRKAGPPMKGFDLRGDDDGSRYGGGKGGSAGRRYADQPSARGWGYGHLAGDETRARSSAYGSMTCAGISSLAIADGALRRLGIGGYSAEERRQTQQAILDGFAFLAKHWAVWENPNQGGYYTYYYLYGLERAAMLTGVKWIGSHDWYWEGAVQLLMSQGNDGLWERDIERTAFAVLFLKRGTRPVITPR